MYKTLVGPNSQQGIVPLNREVASRALIYFIQFILDYTLVQESRIVGLGSSCSPTHEVVAHISPHEDPSSRR